MCARRRNEVEYVKASGRGVRRWSVCKEDNCGGVCEGKWKMCKKVE